MAEETTKPFWLSKTLWFNVITVALVVADEVLGLSFLPPNVGEVIIVIVAALNVVLRLITTKAVTLVDEREDEGSV